MDADWSASAHHVWLTTISSQGDQYVDCDVWVFFSNFFLSLMHCRLSSIITFSKYEIWSPGKSKWLSIFHVLAMQTNYEDPRSKTLEVDVGNERLCTYCEQFTAQAIYYLSENKTQSEIVEALHRTCSRLHTFHKEVFFYFLLGKMKHPYFPNKLLWLNSHSKFVE